MKYANKRIQKYSMIKYEEGEKVFAQLKGSSDWSELMKVISHTSKSVFMYHNGNIIKVAEIYVQPVEDELEVVSTLVGSKHMGKGPNDLAGSTTSVNNDSKQPDVAQARSDTEEDKNKSK